MVPLGKSVRVGLNGDPTFPFETGVVELGAKVNFTGDKTVVLWVMAFVDTISTFYAKICVCEGLEVFVSVLERDIFDTRFPLLKFIHKK